MDTNLAVSHLKIKTAECIKVKGSIMPEAKSFAVNLGRNGSDLILRFNLRFYCHGDTRTVVRNFKTGGEWGEDLRESLFPFQQGEEIKIDISFDEKEMTKLPGDQELKFPNRLGLESAEFLSMNRDFRIKSIKSD